MKNASTKEQNNKTGDPKTYSNDTRIHNLHNLGNIHVRRIFTMGKTSQSLQTKIELNIFIQIIFC